MKKHLPLIFLLVFIFCIIFNNKLVTTNIQTAIILFQNKIFPSLFPFLVLSPLLINYGFLNISQKIFGSIMRKVFHLSENTSYIFLMSLFTGFPGSSMYAKELYNESLISKEDVSKIILFSHFSNPIFIFSMLSTKPLLVLSVHYLSNILIGLIFKSSTPINTSTKNKQIKQVSFFTIFSKSIKQSIETLFFILGVIVFFFMLSSVINNPIANVVLELSQGLIYVNNYFENKRIIAAISSALLSFGGFSVHMQTYGILADLDFSYFKYLKARLFHALLSFIIIYFIF
jgi:hypothetical protein